MGRERAALTGWPRNVALRTFKQLLRGGVRQSDVAVEPGGDQAAADGLNNIFVQRLQVFQRPASVFQLYVNLAQLRRQQSGQIGHRQIAEQIDEDDGLECAQARDGSSNRKE